MAKQSAFDPGLIAVVAVLIAILVAIVYLVMQATSAPTGDGVSDPAEVRQPIPEPQRGLVRRGTREKLEREIEKAKGKLEQARLHRIQDPVGGWDEIIAATEQEIAQLREQLRELGK